MADRATEPRIGLGARLAGVWRELDRNQRLAGAGAAVLIFSLVLPWFQQKGIQQVQDLKLAPGASRTEAVTIVLNGFEVFSWIEAALMLVALGVLAMIFARGERRPFHLPGGDGAVITAAGGWSLFLIAYRVLFFKPEHVGLETGVQWGLLVAVAGAVAITVAGLRIHAAQRPEPPNPAADHEPAATVAVPGPDRDPGLGSAARPPAASGTQLRFGDVEPAGRAKPDDDPPPAPDVDATVEQQLEIPIDEPPPGRRRGGRGR